MTATVELTSGQEKNPLDVVVQNLVDVQLHLEMR